MSAALHRISVVVADDHGLFRRGLVVALEEDRSIEVVGEAEDGPACVETVRELAPDVAMVDVTLPLLDGIAAAAAIAEASPAVSIVMLAAAGDHYRLFDALWSGASGLVMKEAALDDATSTVHRVLDGGCLLDAMTAGALLDEAAVLSDPARLASRGGGDPVELTARELDALGHLADGHDVDAAASLMGLDRRRTELVVNNALSKLQRRAEYEMAAGLVEISSVN